MKATAAKKTANAADARRLFHERLRRENLAEGYSYDDGGFVTRPYWPLEPRNDIAPCLWPAATLKGCVREAGNLVGLGHGKLKYDRRVLALTNPGLGQEFTTSGPLFADIQLLKTGERAPCHRHTPCATRFVIEGKGWTSVAGERVTLLPGDIVFTGMFPWHDHGNDAKADFLFLDILDIPLLYHVGASKWEFDYERVTGSKENVSQPVSAVDFPNDDYAGAQLRPRFAPSWRREPRDFAHLPWAKLRPALDRLKGERGSPHDGVLLEMTSTDGGPVGKSMSVFTQLLRKGEETLAHRHTAATIYFVAEGRGETEIEGKTYAWGPHDVFVVPSWHWHRHASKGGEAVLHSINDASLLSKLGLLREQARGADGKVADTGWHD
jgi:gentisate 1,2-dioxygenase